MTSKLIAGNWKMNGLAQSIAELEGVIAGRSDIAGDTELLLCPPATLVAAFAMRAQGTGVRIGGQDCHTEASGAHTGDISAEMLADAGASHVIVGHSERRADHGESDETVRAKVEAAWRAGLVAIACVGETEAERDAGQALDVVRRQLAGSLPDGATADTLVVAYEPVWAIGTGRTPTDDDVAAVHAAIRSTLEERFGEAGKSIKILYGGSVKPANAAALLAIDHVDGALVGGASLKASDFLAIAEGASAS
ncbi:triose-phosphate isomerase [Amorphus orientalis]|uniref:Triosephosphate isomerase n=1 Tax=Amorphus orientalis TaxID=649198 RepID=A0AAE3VPS9_9HYPH|nr:triose-phosphate isomerase [Amorphus orientalis]MDQ0315565.1 triosephosphate isomerase [Amorphus orientalis]